MTGFSKEVTVTGCDGVALCAALSDRLASLGHDKPESFVLLNDTIAAMLGGMAAVPSEGGAAGFVLGTGTNTCYSERGENIVKLGSPDGSMIINIESAGFDGARRGEPDRLLDARTANPGDHLFEKMVSGAYLGDLMLLTLLKAASEGIMSKAASTLLNKVQNLSLKSAGAFLFGSDSVLSNYLPEENDRLFASEICSALIDRAAKLTVCNIAAIMEKTDAGKNPSAPFTIAAEGSTFYKAFSFYERFSKYADSYITGQLGRHFRIYGAENLTLSGCAAAASMSR